MKHLLLIFVIVFAFDSAASQWTQRASIEGSGRHRACGVGLGNRGYMGLGHFNGVGFEVYFNDWWAFDPATNSWSQKAIYPGNNGNGNLGCHCWTFENKIYVGLGEIDHRFLFRYDPITNTWEPLTPAPPGVNFQDTQEMILDNKAYFTDIWNSDFYVYDCITDTWTLIGPMPIAWNFTYSSFTYDGFIWIKADMDMYAYEPAQDIWYQVISAGTFPGHAVRGSGEFFLNGKFYIVGGYGTTFGDITKEVWEFDPVSYQWTQMQDFDGTARRFTKSFVINDKAYICTGTNGTNFNDLWEFNRTANTNMLQNEISVRAFPNPATDHFEINSDIDQFQIEIYDFNGSVIRREKTLTGKLIVSNEGLPSGTYIYKIISDDLVLKTDRLVFL